MNARKKSESGKPDGHLRLDVRDFGPVAEGAVELRPLTVFAGPSNTGKSWMATLVYVLERYLNATNGDELSSALQRRQLYREDEISCVLPEDPARWLESIRKRDPLPFTDRDRHALKDLLEERQKALGEELLRCFGLSELCHLRREQATEAASINVVGGHLPVTRHRVRIDGNISLRVDIANSLPLPAGEAMPDQLIEDLLEDMVSPQANGRGSERGRNLLIARFFEWFFLDGLGQSAFYLPAERGGVMHAHRVVVNSLIQNASRPGPRRYSPQPALSGVLSDFLQNLIEFPDGSHTRQVNRRCGKLPDSLADQLEQAVLKGTIEAEKSDLDYPRFMYIPKGWDRPLSLVSVSSMVSELAPVAFYLRHHVREGDLLILEEPEAHLHPAMQIAFVREIAEWVRQGIRVIITTHSEWVLEELANLVAAGETGKDGTLSRDQVGMWLFDPGEGGAAASRIREIPWDPDQGGFDAGFDEVARALHNKWATLMENAR